MAIALWRVPLKAPKDLVKFVEDKCRSSYGMVTNLLATRHGLLGILGVSANLRVGKKVFATENPVRIEITSGGGVTIHNVNNVILSNISIHDVKVIDGFNARSGCDGDDVAVKTATKVWIDHCTMSKGLDGLLDVTVGSTGVTISNSRFHDHDKVLLLGADDSHSQDKNMHITVAFNRFAKGTYTEEGGWKNWNWRSTDDVLENGAIFKASGSDPQLIGEQQVDMIPHEPGSKVADLACSAGVLRRIGNIFTSVYAAVQKLKKDSWKEIQFSLVDNSKLNVVYLLNRS
ncbi:pectate lyase 1-like protein [Tanacetum coccineum]